MPEPPAESKKLFVTNIQGKVGYFLLQIPEEEVKEDLIKEFEQFAKVADIVVKSRENSSNTYCFVEF